MSEAIIAKKAELVDVVAEKMKAAASIVVVDARGLTVEQDTVLRRELRGSEVEYKVIKNSILRRAAEKAGLEDLASVFVGPSAVAFSNEDVIAPAKILNDFSKNAEALEIKGGAIEGAVASKEEILALATLPNREGLLSMLLSVLQAPVRNVALAVKAEKAGLEELASVFVGPSAVAFSNEDVIAPAKILNDFSKNAEALEIKGGAIEGAVASKEEILALATLPNREGLLSMLLSVLQAPVRNVALAVKAVADNKEDAA